MIEFIAAALALAAALAFIAALVAVTVALLLDAATRRRERNAVDPEAGYARLP